MMRAMKLPYRQRLKSVTYIVSEHVGQEVHHDTVLPGILLTQSADSLHHHHLK